MKATDEQQDIIDVVAGGSDLVIEAGAGTGKSSTLRLIAKNEDKRRGICIYFNRAPAAEARRTFPKNVSCSTAHSLAWNAMKERPFMSRLDGGPVPAKQIAEEFLHLKNWFRTPQGYKDISTWKIASLAVQTVKRYCYSDADVITERHVPTSDLHLPADVDARLRGEILPIARDVWTDLQRADGWAQFTPDHYMKMWALENPVLDADFMMVDECFPAGTLVETSDGPVAIERIAEQPEHDWEVLASVDGGKTLTWSNVNSAYRTPRRNRLVRIYHEHGSLTCTANHPVWVVRGDGEASGAWTPAGLVREGDSVPCVQRLDEEGEPYLFFGVQPEADRHGALAGVGVRTAGEDLEAHEGRPLGDAQPDERPGGAPAVVEDAAQDRPQAAGSGRERDRADGMRGSALYGADEDLRSAALEPRSCRLVWSTSAWPADQLQDRRRVLEEDDRGRGGRVLALVTRPTRRGSPQGRVPVLSRVDRVAFLESGDQIGSGEGRADDHVYTLSVEAGSYIADGVLVKNCQDTNGVLAGIVRKQDHLQRVLVGDSQQRLFSWRGTVDMMREFKHAEVRYLTQSFRFGPAVADEANLWLEYLEAPIRLRGLESINSRLDFLEHPDAILCRTNADTIEQALGAQERGFDVAIVGGTDEIFSFATGVDQLRDTGKTSHRELSVFKTWQDVVDYVTDEKPGGNFATAVKLCQRYGTGLVKKIAYSCVDERNADYVISTVHKVKGLEWNNVLLDRNIAPDEADTQEASEMSRGELMLAYVAVTRARQVLDAASVRPFHDRRRHMAELVAASTKDEDVDRAVRETEEAMKILGSEKG